MARRVEDRETRRASLSGEPLAAHEYRAVTWAYANAGPVGSDSYHGARDGWLAGYGYPTRTGLETLSRTSTYWRAWERGHAAGEMARYLETVQAIEAAARDGAA
ncbi:MAG: hypothetical protein M0R75_01610 [Dehalococcoidia bacterium]|nr:hypothetical protein [Dehalococcoidia bacterium]